jgi:hypothetical protein
VEGTIEGWNLLAERYPDSKGLVTLSYPGYSADGDSALVSWSFGRGPLAVEGFVSFLERIDGDWAILWTESIFVS